MEYTKRNVNGDAGEYLVAYKFTKMFGWPCRLYGIDLGVDAETEVIDDQGHSTGDIIKIQIKSFDSISSTDAAAVYPDDRHIDYWKRFCLPVIICCVDLSTEKVYWKQVTSTEAYESSGISKKISFNLKNDVLDQNSKYSLQKLVMPEASKRIDELFVQLDKISVGLPQTTSGYIDFQSIYKTEDLCNDVTLIINEIDELITNFPWRVSSLALRKLNNIKGCVRMTKNDCNISHNDLTNGG